MLPYEKRLKIALDNKDTIRTNVKKLLELSDRQWGRSSLDQDFMRGKITGDLNEYVNLSILEGKKKAAERKESVSDDLGEIIQATDIEFIVNDRENALNYIIFGMYKEPKTLTVFMDNIEQVQKMIKELGLEDIITRPVLDTIIAHELFHYEEEIDPEIYTRATKIELWKFLFYKRKSGIRTLSEVGAMAYCKELLGLQYNPDILDYLFSVAFDYEVSEELYNFLINYKDM